MAAVEYRRYGGYDDRRLPTALWKAQGTVIGDASGGTRLIQFAFNLATAVPLSRLYSLEAMYATDGDNIQKVVRVISSNLDRITNAPRLLQFNLVLDVGVSQAQLSPESTLVTRKMWLGQQVNALTLTTVLAAQIV